MTVSSREQPLDDARVDVRTRIGDRYDVHAREIADALGERPLCVATGPRRFGKTTSLLPRLAGIVQERGNATHIINGRDYEREPLTIHALPSEQFDVLIIDEANVLTRNLTQTEDVLRLLHTKGNVIVSMITFEAGYEPESLYSARIWQSAEFSISGFMANIVCLPQMILTHQDAHDLLVLYSPIREVLVRERVLSYIIERVPLNPHVLLELAGARSIGETNTIIRQRKSTFFQHALTPDEYRELEESLEEQA